MIDGHGDDIYKQAVKIKSNFSSNVFYQGESRWLSSFLEQHLAVLHSYPEPNADSFVKKIAEKNKIPYTTICATHGATDAIYIIAQTFAKSKTVILTPTFSEYEDACIINQHRLSFCKDLDEVSDSYDLVWLCNPNNPTGQTHDYKLLLQVIDKYPKTTFIIDQTYRYFTQKETLSYTDAVQRPNVILIDSFTKRFALPDLRLGYFVANADLVKKVQFYKQPWAVSQLAIEVGKYLMDNEPYPLNLETLLQETNRLRTALGRIKEITSYPTDTHFFLCECQEGTAAELKQYLVHNQRLLIRDAANFRGLNASFFRIATQKTEANNTLVEALTNYFAK